MMNVSAVTRPTAYIAVNRNRLKLYKDSVYLKGGTCFEIELFNPTTTKVLAKIYLNGLAISTSGIVLRPGQRVFLERWIDKAQLFVYDTYEVDGTSDSLAAIKENGKVRVEFYDQVSPYHNCIGDPIWIVQPSPYDYSTGGVCTFATTTNYHGCTGADGVSGIPGGSYTTQTTISSDVNYHHNPIINVSCSNTSSVETGSVEHGGASSQSFSTDYSNYYSYPSTTVDIKILPESSKPVEEIRNYCSKCGTRKKSTGWKFCPVCGTEI